MTRRAKGTNLWKDPRTGMYVYRRTDPITGRRFRQSTGTKVLELALRAVAEFEKERDKKKVGLETLDCWREKLAPLVGRWIEALEAEAPDKAVAKRSLRDKRRRVERALQVLDLRVAADLDRVGRLHDRLLKLEKEGKTRKHLRRCYQEPLKQLSRWLAENKRVLDRDPLATWALLKVPPAASGRRALLPDEVARALAALDTLGTLKHRAHPLRPVFTALLIAAPRASALASRDVGHFDPVARRLRFGADVGKKRKGAGALDARTAAELAAYVGDRKDGPLFRGPDGSRPDERRLRLWWREAVGFGLVEELWPAGEAWEPFVAHLTNQWLLSGQPPRARRGGPTPQLRAETRAEWSRQEAAALRVGQAVEEVWRRRMEGVDVHALRMTHRSWAEAKGVPPVLIDKQLGHAGPSTTSVDTLRLLAGSETGRRHYLDLRSALLDAARSAEAVRELLDEAVARRQAAEERAVS